MGDLRTLTEDRRTRTIQVEELRHQLKKGSEDIARLKREKQPADEAMAAMKALGETIKGHEEQLRVVEEQLAHIALRIRISLTPLSRTAGMRLTILKCADGERRRSSRLRPNPTGILAKRSAFWISTVRCAWPKPALPY